MGLSRFSLRILASLQALAATYGYYRRFGMRRKDYGFSWRLSFTPLNPFLYKMTAFLFLLVFCGCAKKEIPEYHDVAVDGALRFVMSVKDVKTRTISSKNMPGSGVCMVNGVIEDILVMEDIKNRRKILGENWRDYFYEGQEITTVAPCKNEYFVEPAGIVSLLKPAVKSAKTMEFWGNDLRDAGYEGCERFRECDLKGRFVFSPIGAKIIGAGG